MVAGPTVPWLYCTAMNLPEAALTDSPERQQTPWLPPFTKFLPSNVIVRLKIRTIFWGLENSGRENVVATRLVNHARLFEHAKALADRSKQIDNAASSSGFRLLVRYQTLL